MKREKRQPLNMPAFFSPDFFMSTTTPWLVPSEWIEITAEQLRELLLSQQVDDLAADSVEWENPNQAAFDQNFRDLQVKIDQGILKKAVPVVFERAQTAMTPQLLSKTLLSLLDRSRNLRIYGLWDAQGGILGASPEDLFEITEAGKVRTMALAGTYRKPEPARLENAKKMLLCDPKERQEHQWVIEDIREALSRFGEVRVGETHVLELPALLHLRTSIELETSEVSFEELVRSLHPTAALGAFPRLAGWDWLRTQDRSQNRDRFGAPFGALYPKRGAICLVAIRNIQWGNNELRLGSGCGVIRESMIDREWEELTLKRESVKRLMGL